MLDGAILYEDILIFVVIYFNFLKSNNHTCKLIFDCWYILDYIKVYFFFHWLNNMSTLK